MKIKNIIIISGFIFFLAILLICISYINMNRYSTAVSELADNRFVTQLIADELKESSYNLSDAVRKFVVTGDEIFADEFMKIVHIMEGERPRPLNYLIAPGETIPLYILMEDAGYSERELELILLSLQLSDRLVEIEIEAMNAVRGIFPDEHGNYTIIGEPDREKGISLIFSQAYIDAISDILEPLNEFLHEMSERFNIEYDLINARRAGSERLMWVALVASIAIFFIFILLIWRLIIHPVMKCRKFAEQITDGNFDAELAINSSNEIGSLADSLRIMLIGLRERIRAEKQRSEADIANKAKSVFIANMSHEIRTPMNSVIGFTELALDDRIPRRTREYLGKIKTNAEWLLQIINDILDLSKIEADKMELESIPFDMHELLNSCRTLVMPKASEKGVELQFNVEPVPDMMPLGDPTRLRQVIVNLLSNAVKFTESGEINLNTIIKETSGDNITFLFEVKDSGIGMTHEQIERVLNPFVQAESETTRKYGGTGLGLVIVSQLLEMMGGKLSIDSEPGVGSTFSFSLTFDTINMNDVEMNDGVILNDFEKPFFKGEILVCEDNIMNQQVICDHLARVGLRTSVAENGKVGIEMVQSRINNGAKMYDMIFMDMHMPVMDGLEAAAKIMELDKEVPLVAMTANIMTDDVEIYLKSGMNDYIGKPFTSHELWRCLMKYLTLVTVQSEDEGERAKGDIELRQKLIRNFVRQSNEEYNEIIRAINDGDFKLAHRRAHTLKGNAGLLAITALQDAAGVVEAQLKNGTNDVTDEQLATLDREFRKAFNELEPLANEPVQIDEAQFTEPLSAEELQELKITLETLLVTGDMECVNLIGKLQRVPGTAELIDYIEDLEFRKALLHLSKQSW